MKTHHHESRIAAASLVVCLAAACSGTDEPTGPAAPLSGEARGLACARLSACTELTLETFAGDLTGYQACMAGLTGLGAEQGLGRVLPCVRDADDCAAVLACVHAAPTDGCDPGARQRCEGDVLVGCLASLPQGRDCSAEGLTCMEGACVEPAACTSSRCDGLRLYQCPFRGGDRSQALDCESHCTVTADGFGVCAPSDEACMPGSDHCEGDVAVACRSGAVRRTQCAFGECLETDGAFCRPAPCESRCEGSVLVGCLDDGLTSRFDCAGLGSGSCIDEGDGAVRCAP